MAHIVLYVDATDPHDKHLIPILKDLAKKDSRSLSSYVRNIFWASIEAIDAGTPLLKKMGATPPRDNPLRAFIAPATRSSR